jgi:hypothetical protein
MTRELRELREQQRAITENLQRQQPHRRPSAIIRWAGWRRA